MQMKEVPKKDEPAVSGGVVPGGGLVIPGVPAPGPHPYPQMPTIPCFPDPTGSVEK
jgi:hypothetical protein